MHVRFAKYMIFGTCEQKKKKISIVSEPVVRRSVPERLTSLRKKGAGLA